ncbi:Arrestin-C domain-containing protein [Mycena indigotica]|uniref:Arrestin-C domain-containing protein n=1 Tax=Mycena indigotica TaxID=2126181 RepID=A0A8H6TAC8_9AGAR|nr:Arrestin-C domain-containing protein [Mycena indigotica]KAF7315110.1 Arrestin-C domain-containing protein [Mycena indigotica]
MKTSLTIRLTEAATFLKTTENNARRRNTQVDGESGSRPSMLRGLLTLNLAKPTKITSIDLELQAKTTISWPEGIGARRVDVQEEHKVFSESVVYFQASPAARRNASVGPGVHPWDASEDSSLDHLPATPDTPSFDVHTARSTRAARRVSADLSYFPPETSIPPYTPLPTPPSSSSHASPAQSFGNLAGEDPAHALEDFRNALRASLPQSRSAAGDRSPVPIRSSGSSVRDQDRSLSRRPSIDTLAEVDEHEPGTSSPNRSVPRGRRARFSLTAVSNVLKDVVRSSSPHREESTRRGRTRDKSSEEKSGRSQERHVRNTLGKLVGLKDDEKKSDGWKEFKKGTYTFPISFAIPPNAPPTMQCPWGTVLWRLKADVHRPGALTSRISASREVIIVAGPTEDDMEGTENIVVERHWEQQLQYLISISGRSFPIGGIVPVSMTLLPLCKVKIHRLSVFLEEKIEYYSQMKRVMRSDPVARLPLLVVKHPDKMGGPILPLVSNASDALETTPLLLLTSVGDDLNELASQWMGPGPWTFYQDLQLPSSCATLHFTNKNKRSNITVTHVLKCIIRVERGDNLAVDPKTGENKLFDIVVQTPIHILSCRCNPEWMSLPQYSMSFEDPADVPSHCPCQTHRHTNGLLERILTRSSSDSTASAVETHQVHHPEADTLFARNIQFERLVAGQESEVGEAPPAYVTL